MVAEEVSFRFKPGLQGNARRKAGLALPPGLVTLSTERYSFGKRKAKAAESTPEPLDLVTWAERHFYVPELMGPLQLADYQKRALAEIFQPTPDGLLCYSTVVWSDLKKSIKSTIAGAVCLWWADTHPWSTIRIVANDLKQADSREGEYIRRAIELNRGYFVEKRGAKVKPSGYSIELGNHSKIEAVPLDPRGEAGGGDDIVVFTELWAAKSEVHKRMWTELTLSPLKYGRSFRWVETYAGFVGESPLLEPLYKAGVEQGRRLDPDVEMFANDSARLFCLWNTQPRLPWQTPEYYAQESATLLPNEYDRVHRNRWVTSEQQAIPPEWWEACRDPLPLRIDTRTGKGESTPLVVAVDASVSGDCTAVTVVSRHPEHKDHVVERLTRVWVPADMPGGKMDYHATVSPLLDKLVADGFNIVEVPYDPYQLHQWAQDRRKKEKPLWYREFNQGADRLLADKGLYDLIRDRRLHHSGNPTLTEHVAHCNAKAGSDEDSKMRLVKRSTESKIDGAVALSMAAAECLRLNLT